MTDITQIPARLPEAYTRKANFTDDYINDPTKPVTPQKVDAELNAIVRVLQDTQARAALIQRDDGALQNESVARETLKPEVFAQLEALEAAASDSANAAAASASAAAASAQAAADDAAATAADRLATAADALATAADRTAASDSANAAAASASAAAASAQAAADDAAATAADRLATAADALATAADRTATADDALATAADRAVIEALSAQFRGTYYGALAADPATDPLGNPPTTGDLYFNNTTSTLRLFDGVAWNLASVDPSTLGSAATYNVGTAPDQIPTFVSNGEGLGGFGYGRVGTSVGQYTDLNDVPKRTGFYLLTEGHPNSTNNKAPLAGFYDTCIVRTLRQSTNDFVDVYLPYHQYSNGMVIAPHTSSGYAPQRIVSDSVNLRTSTGNSTIYPMSQKAVTEALGGKADTDSLGTSATRDVATNTQALAGTAGVLPDAEQVRRNHVAQVATIADLRALEPAFDGQQVELLCHTVAGLGGGLFYADYGSTAADDNGVVVVTTGGKRWIRKLDGFVTPGMFGAIGDGVTDDTAAIQAVLDSGALEVVAPAGVYIVSSVTVAGVVVSGVGTLKWKGNTATPMLTLSGSGCVLKGLTLDGNAAGQSSSTEMIVTLAAPNTVIEECTIKNGRYKAFLSDVANSPGIAVRNNLFIDWGTIGSCDVVSFRSPRFIAAGNRFENIGDGHCIRTGLRSGDPTTVPVTNGTIVGNVFYNTQHVGVTVELYAQGLSITGNTFDTLNAGVKVEADGATQFDITIDGNVFKNLDGSGVGTSLNLTGNNVIFSNNIVRDCAGVCDVGSNSVVIGNTFDNCGDVASGTSAIRATSSAFSKAVVTGNIITNSPYRAIEGGADSIITNNVIKTTADRAINLGGASRARVIGNIIDGCTYGIIANSSSNDILVSANDVRNASVSSYSIVDADSAYLDQNNFGLSLALPARTIATGAITAPRQTGAVIKIDTEAAAASDDLDTINVLDGGQIGHTIVLRLTTATRVVTVKDNTGNLRLAGDFVMNSPADTITLIWTGSSWDEVSRSDNQ